LNNGFAVGQVYRLFDDMLGASNCSSTGGGSDWSAFTLAGTNPFLSLFATSAPAITISPAAQAALSTLSGDALSLATNPLQVAAAMQAIITGVTLPAPVPVFSYSGGALPAPLGAFVFLRNCLAEAIGTGLFSNGGILSLISPPSGYPVSAAGLPAGGLFSNGGVVGVAGVPDPVSAPAVYFGAITAAELLALGGENLPLADPGVGSMQLWNNGGVVCVA
jgi:hypothetical protein